MHTEAARTGQLKWLTLFRVALVTVLLIATVVFNLDDSKDIADRLYGYLYYLCTAVYVMSFFYTVALRAARSQRQLTAVTYLQFTGDVLLAAALVLVTGGTDSAFTFFFSLVIIGGAIILFRPGAVYLASVSFVLFLTIGLVEVDVLPYRDELAELRVAFIPEPQGVVEQMDRYYHVVYNVVLNGLAFFGVALLASWLSEQLRRSTLTLRAEQQSLTALRALHEDIVNSMLTGLVTIDRERRVTLFNPAAREIVGLPPEAVIGRDVVDIFPDLGAVLADAQLPASVRREESRVAIGARRVYVGWSISPLRDAQGELTGHTFMFQDITRIKEMERAMQRTEKMAAVGELAAGIAHEIRNPLASMSGSIQLLQSSAPLDPDDRRLLDIVLRETDHLNRWITDFLDYSRPRPIDPQPLDVDRLLDDTLDLFRQDGQVAGITVEKTSDGPLTVLGDASRIKQVAWNLLINAAEASPPDGRIEVTLRSKANGSMPQIELAVTDHGQGIAPEALDRVFQPFFTTKEHGTGLGLATVHRIVDEHQGRVLVDSEVGRGSTFRVLLPLARPVEA